MYWLVFLIWGIPTISYKIFMSAFDIESPYKWGIAFGVLLSTLLKAVFITLTAWVISLKIGNTSRSEKDIPK